MARWIAEIDGRTCSFSGQRCTDGGIRQRENPARLVGITISSEQIEVDGKPIEQVYLPREQT